MKRMGAFVGVVIVIFLILVISGAFYTVREWDQVVITRFGEPIGKPKTEAGLYFKIPVIEKLHRYEKRILRWDGDPKEIPTRDKRFIYVDTTARWRIVDARRFLEVLGNYTQAYAKLDDIIDAVVRDYVSANPLVELVRSTDWTATLQEGEEKVLSPFPDATARETIVLGREKITRAILAEASKAMPAFGMKLVDVRIKRINYVEQVQKKVYERMISERKRKAAQSPGPTGRPRRSVATRMQRPPRSMGWLSIRTRSSMRSSKPSRHTRRQPLRTPLLSWERIRTTTGF